MPTTTISTTLLESVNIVLANLGESPVNTLSGGALPQQVSLALNTIEEVSTDIQSKGWWFNQQTASAYSTTANVVIYPSNTANDWGSSIPEEARRYITIRASRIAQTRLIGSEELQKFSYNEELVSLAILQQAHVRNSGGVLDFNDFPAELRGLGMDEVMFLQGNVEEKIGTLRLGGELANIAKTKAETSLIADQEALVAQQALTEVQNTNLVTQNAIKVAADAGLVTSQQALIAQQVLDVVADTSLKTKQGTKIDEEVDLLQTQDLLTGAQKDTELQNAIKVAAEAGLVTSQQALVAQQVLDTVADTAIKGSQKLKIDEEKLLVTEQKTLVTKQALTEVQNAIKVSADSGLVTAQQALVSQQVLDAASDIVLKGKQGSLVDAQVTTEGKRPADVEADTTLKGSQSSLVTAQALTEAQNAIKVAADAGLVTTQQALISQQVLDVAADIALKGKQGSLVDAQATDVAADTALKSKQGSLVDAQTTTEGSQQAVLGAQATNIGADSALKGAQTTTEGSQQSSLAAQATKFTGEGTLATNQAALIVAQKDQLLAQTAIEATAEKAFYDGVVAGTQNTYRDFAAEMRMMGVQETQFQGMPAYKKVELIKDANKLRAATATETSANSYDAGEDEINLREVNKVMRLIGESPVSAFNTNSLASECIRLLRDTNQELQGRGWWFNTFKDVELVPSSGGYIDLTYTPDDSGLNSQMGKVLSAEVDGVPTFLQRNQEWLYNKDKQSFNSWTSPVKATLIIQQSLSIVPDKYLEYLNVRVAILLTELYPQSGIDIQRLPKMEQELRAYFKDREFDEANYSVFDNYDAASRIGIHRNYDLT